MRTSIPAGGAPIAQTDLAREFSLTAEIRGYEEDSRLYDKFVVAVKRDGGYIGRECAAVHHQPGGPGGLYGALSGADSIKGLLVDSQKLGTTELDELGVKACGL